MKIMLRHTGDGFFEAVTQFDRQFANDKCPVGKTMWHDIREPRSAKQNKWFHVMLRVAFDNLPEEYTHAQDGDDPRVPSVEYLRDWALVNVGWAEHADFEMEATEAISAIGRLAAMIRQIQRRGDKAVFVYRTKRGIRASWPKSIAYGACPQDKMNEITDRVLALMENKLGIPRGLLEPQIPDRHKREEAAT